jgi:hypothetical protein
VARLAALRDAAPVHRTVSRQTLSDVHRAARLVPLPYVVAHSTADTPLPRR